MEYLVLRRTGEEVSEGNCTMRSLMICTPHQVLFGFETKGNDMVQACSAIGGEESCIQGVGRNT